MPNLDKIHYKFFPKSQTASTGSKLIYFAWIIEIAVALVGLSIAMLFFTSGGETGLKLGEVSKEVGVDAFIVIWSNLTYWKILAKIVSLKPIKILLEYAYNIFAQRRFNNLSHCQMSLEKEKK